jgi:hypothetical protein
VWHPVFDFREGGTEATGTAITRSRRDQGPYVFDEEDQERFKKMVGEIVVKNLANSKRFDVVTTLGPGTLFVRCAMLDIVSDVPPDLGRNSTKVHLASVGEATVVFELIDAETGVIQARVAERRTIQAPGRMHQVSAMPSTTNSVWNDVKLWATDVAQTLRRELDKAKKKADKYPHCFGRRGRRRPCRLTLFLSLISDADVAPDPEFSPCPAPHRVSMTAPTNTPSCHRRCCT